VRKQDYKLEADPKIIWRLRRTKELSCSFCKPHRNENSGKKGKRGTRPPRSKNRLTSS
jgi:hypothetical protein